MGNQAIKIESVRQSDRYNPSDPFTAQKNLPNNYGKIMTIVFAILILSIFSLFLLSLRLQSSQKITNQLPSQIPAPLTQTIESVNTAIVRYNLGNKSRNLKIIKSTNEVYKDISSFMINYLLSSDKKEMMAYVSMKEEPMRSRGTSYDLQTLIVAYVGNKTSLA